MDLIERAKREKTPLIENGRAIFVWKGERPPTLSADFTHWHYGQPLALQAAGPGLWTYTLEVPPGAYLEYIYNLDGQRVLDPLNPRKTPNGMGKYNNYFYVPPARPTPLTRLSGGRLRGKVTREFVEGGYFVAGGRRLVYFYQPPVSKPVPLVVVWDGYDFFRRAHIAAIVDNLIASQRIAPVALAMVQNGKSARMLEYACNDATLGFLQSAVLPAARTHLTLLDQPGAFGVLGASMGGLMALYTAYRLPHIFGKALCLSSAFVVDRQEQVLFDLIRHGEPKEFAAWLDVGLFDYVHLLESNRRMRSLLESRGYPVTYREYPAGHSYPAWRDELWRGFEHFYGQQNPGEKMV